jgi:putative hydrolase of the HAD superfamily
MYDAVLLDLYDTLAWSDWVTWQHRLAEALGVDVAVVGRAFDVTRSARSTGTYADADADLASVIEALGIAPDTEQLRALRQTERQIVEERVHLHADSMPVVRELRERGVRTVLVSNCSHNTRPVVERLRLEDEFDAVILSFELGAMKPQPEIYRSALEAAGGIEPERSVFVDDQSAYCDGAAALGIDTRLIVREGDPQADPRSDGRRHATIASLTELL